MGKWTAEGDSVGEHPFRMSRVESKYGSVMAELMRYCRLTAWDYNKEAGL
jgi:hypothetical protein